MAPHARYGRTYQERAGLVEQAWASLQARNLGRPASPDPVFAGLLIVLVGPHRSVDARIGHRGAEVRALAGAPGVPGWPSPPALRGWTICAIEGG